jgi:hypothetical protein
VSVLEKIKAVASTRNRTQIPRSSSQWPNHHFQCVTAAWPLSLFAVLTHWSSADGDAIDLRVGELNYHTCHSNITSIFTLIWRLSLSVTSSFVKAGVIYLFIYLLFAQTSIIKKEPRNAEHKPSFDLRSTRDHSQESTGWEVLCWHMKFSAQRSVWANYLMTWIIRRGLFAVSVIWQHLDPQSTFARVQCCHFFYKQAVQTAFKRTSYYVSTTAPSGSTHLSQHGNNTILITKFHATCSIHVSPPHQVSCYL